MEIAPVRPAIGPKNLEAGVPGAEPQVAVDFRQGPKHLTEPQPALPGSVAAGSFLDGRRDRLVVRRKMQVTPRLSDWSFRSAVRTAHDACDEFEPDVIVGSSRGGAVAMARSDVPLVLLAPAWRWCGVEPRVSAPKAVVIHSPSDRWVRFDDSRELRRRNPHVRLIAAGDGHRLNDPTARAALAEVLDDLFPTKEKPADADR